MLEDDLEVSPHLLAFFSGVLDAYRDDRRIFSVSGYTPPFPIPSAYRHQVFLLPRCSSWGWATWRDRWEQVDWAVGDRHLLRDPAVRDRFDRTGTDLSDLLERWIAGRVDSWAIRFNWAHFRHNAFSVLPTKSLVRSIGCDGSGRHVRATKRYEVTLDDTTSAFVYPPDIAPDEEIITACRRFFDASLRRRMLRIIRTLFTR